MIDTRIYTFLEVCNTMNYTRAAEKLHITQPAVTHHIRWLEREYGVVLFGMQGKKLYLTREGELLQEMASAMCVNNLRIQKNLKESLKKKERLSIGATLTVGEYLMPRVLERYLQDYPHTDISMYVKNTKNLLAMLKEGTIDFAAVEGNFDKKYYGCVRISREPYIGVCGAGFEGTGRIFTWEELFKNRLIIREKGSGTREIFERFLLEHSCSLENFNHTIEVSNMGAVKSMTEKNMGITFLYRRAVEQELEEKRLFPLQIDGFSIERDFYFVYIKDSIFADKYDTIIRYFS